MNALTSIDWDTLFGYVIHDYSFVAVVCAVALSTLAFAVRIRTRHGRHEL